MANKLWFQTAIGIILTLIIIRLFIEVKEIFEPLFIIAGTIFVPLLLSGVLFYLTRPILYFLMKRKFPKWSAILIIAILILSIFWFFYVMIGPAITEQVNTLVENAPEIMEDIEGYVEFIMDQRERLPEAVEEQIENMTQEAGNWASGLGMGLMDIVTTLISGIISIILVPFFLIYLLIDHHKFMPFVSKFFSGERRVWIRKTMKDIDTTLRAFIQGQLIVSFLVGVMLLIGYLIIGLEYALLLALVGMVMNVIPFIGPYIAVIPAMIIALVQDPIMAIWVAVIMLVAQQIESTFISPNVMGTVLDVHPLTVITVILAAGNIAGFWGILLAIPTYAVLKTIIQNIYERRQEIRNTATKNV